MIKKLVLIFGVCFLIVLNIKLQFDKIQLIKTQNSMYDTIEAFKVSNQNYQDLLRDIAAKIGRECPDFFKGVPHSPELKAPSIMPRNLELPELNIDSSNPPLNQMYKLNGTMPVI